MEKAAASIDESVDQAGDGEDASLDREENIVRRSIESMGVLTTMAHSEVRN